MYYLFEGLEGDSSVLASSVLDKKVYSFGLNHYYFYANNSTIRPECIPKGTCMGLEENSKFQVIPSDQIYLLQVYQIASEVCLLCKTINAPYNDVSIDLNNLLWQEDFSQVDNSVLEKLIGEFILVTKQFYKVILMPLKDQIMAKTSISKLIWEEYKSAKISKVEAGFVQVTTSKNKNLYDSLPVFLLMNHLNPSVSYNFLIGKTVKVIAIDKIPHFKIKKQKKSKQQKTKGRISLLIMN